MSHIGPVGSAGAADGGAGMTFCVSWQFAIPQDNATSTAHDKRAIARNGRTDTPPKKRRSMIEPLKKVATSTIPALSHLNPVKQEMIGILIFPRSRMQASDGQSERLFATFPRPFFAKGEGWQRNRRDRTNHLSGNTPSSRWIWASW
jgi:hypothetical protein